MKRYIKNMDISEIIERLKKGENIKNDKNPFLFFLRDGLICGGDGNNFKIGCCIDIFDRNLYFEIEEPFEITETGLYKTRDGRRAFVCRIDESHKTFPIKGIIEGSTEDEECTWTKKGYELINETHNTDIVSKWEE